MKPRRFLVAALAVAVILLGWLAYAKTQDNARATVTAVFVDSSPLAPGNKVQLDGVEVGTISSISLVGGQSHVRMSLDRSVLPLHTDATAKIQPVSLLGERFIALGQGTPSAPVLAQPMVIPASRTGSSVDLDDLLNTLSDPTSTALAATVTTLGQGIAGQGDSVAKALTVAQPSLHQADQLSRLLDQQNSLLTNLIVAAQRNATAFAQPLDSLVGSARQSLGAVAANRQALDGAVGDLPSTLASARRTLGNLGTMADNTTDVLAGVRPLTDNLVDASGELSDFADAAKPALNAAPDALDRLDHLLDEARPVIHDLKPAAGDLRSVGTSLNTLSNQILTHDKGVPSQLENAMTGLANWAMTTTGYDGLAHYFRAVVVASPSTVGTTLLGPLPPVGKNQPFNPVRDDPSGQSGYPPTKPLPFVPTLPNPDGAENGGHAPKNEPRTRPEPEPGNATGLTPKQESNMFDQLLGGGN
ncbi:MlaD family protein [Pseudonocardia spinosispora]|uniref:MlaD family protein n=1 Tax=Pseudonocardia spinosispora TaxID=103441 RepID=UPI00048BC4D1|nr:MlaD family protein [Pseudonocardia spinosispora]